MSTELLPLSEDPALPAIDMDLLDGAVLWLNRAMQASGVQLAVEVSEYVVATFLGGDAARLSSHDPRKTASFQALSQRADLQMGATTLYRLVRIGEQVRHLPAEIAQGLTLRHHRALLTVPNLQHKQRLARQAVRQAWTSEQLASTIRAEQPQTGKPRGRPVQPAVVKWVAGLRRASLPAASATDFASVFGSLPETEQALVRAELLAVQGRIQTLLAAVAG